MALEASWRAAVVRTARAECRVLNQAAASDASLALNTQLCTASGLCSSNVRPSENKKHIFKWEENADHWLDVTETLSTPSSILNKGSYRFERFITSPNWECKTYGKFSVLTTKRSVSRGSYKENYNKPPVKELRFKVYQNFLFKLL